MMMIGNGVMGLPDRDHGHDLVTGCCGNHHLDLYHHHPRGGDRGRGDDPTEEEGTAGFVDVEAPTWYRCTIVLVLDRFHHHGHDRGLVLHHLNRDHEKIVHHGYR
jgi:hypothetical protein